MCHQRGKTVPSPVYWHPVLYKAAMRLLYGRRGYEGRYEELTKWIPAGASVFEACAGDCRLYLKYLRQLGVDYRAGDFNEVFVKHGRRQGVAIDRFDLRNDPIPKADVVLIQASLYQFLPGCREVLLRLAAAAAKRLIVVEPIRNLASSDNAAVAWLGRLGAKTEDQDHPSRFTDETITRLMQDTFGERVAHSALVANERERLFCVSTNPQ